MVKDRKKLESEVSRVLTESNQALADLLKTELAIAVTFVETSQTERKIGELAAAQRALTQARKARDTIARFLSSLGRLHDRDRAEIKEGLEKLNRLLEGGQPSVGLASQIRENLTQQSC
jgi:hypothetical protein